MYRLNLRLTVVMLTIVVGISATSLWFMYHRQSDEESPKVASGSSPIEKRTYDEIEVVAHGVTDGGLPEGHGAFTSSDGIRFSWRRITFGSPQRARRELQKKLYEAVEIVKREAILNDKGREVGEKAVATFPVAKGSSGVSAKILWTTGSDFGYVEGPSLESILKYEKDRIEYLRRTQSNKALQLTAR